MDYQKVLRPYNIMCDKYGLKPTYESLRAFEYGIKSGLNKFVVAGLVRRAYGKRFGL